MSIPYKDSKRIQESLLAPLERRALIWLARRMPACIHSDHLTLLGFLAQFLAGLCYFFSASQPLLLLAVNVCLIANWFGDSLDGTLARFRNHLRPRYGFYVDHMVDTFGALFLVGGLALSGRMIPEYGLILLIGYYMLAINSFLATHSLGTFQISFGKLSPTELRLLLATGNCVAFFKPVVIILGRPMSLFDAGALAGAAGMVLLTVVLTIRNTVTLYGLEKLPPRAMVHTPSLAAIQPGRTDGCGDSAGDTLDAGRTVRLALSDRHAAGR